MAAKEVALRNNWVPGTPEWVSATQTADPGIANLYRNTGLQLIAGCVDQAAEACNAKIAEGVLMDRIEDAARLDMESSAGAVAAYAKALRSFPTPSDASTNPNMVAHLQNLRSIVQERQAGTSAHEQRHAIILPVAIPDYSSPLIGKVPHAESDVLAYAGALQGVTSTSSESVQVLPVANPGDKSEFLRLLKDVRSQIGARTQDLLILVFSGRGFTTDSGRYLAMRNVMPANQLTPRTNAYSQEGLVELGEIARALDGVWFFGIYDAQFTTPQSEPGRADGILDKHLDSVRPRGDAPKYTTLSSRAVNQRTAAKNIRRQVHMWFEGTVTQSINAANPCDSQRNVSSPLAALILAALPDARAKSYRDWLPALTKSNGCLKQGQIVMQGDLDVPFLASGEGAEMVAYLRSTARRDMNLENGFEAVQNAADRFPSPIHMLAKAALYLAEAELHEANPSIRPVHLVLADMIKEAEDVLEGMSDIQGEQDLSAMKFELLARALLRNGNPEAARDQLLKLQPEILSRRHLPDQLLTAAEESLRRQPSEVLGQVQSVISALPGPASQGARARLNALLSAEQNRASGPYEITIPEQDNR